MGKSLKGTKSFENLKEAFAGESQANRRYLYLRAVPTSRGIRMWVAYSETPRRRRPAMPSGIWTFSRKSAIR